MGASTIVMADVLAKDSLQMGFVKWNEEVQAFSPAKDEGTSFAAGSGLHSGIDDLLFEFRRQHTTGTISLPRVLARPDGLTFRFLWLE